MSNTTRTRAGKCSELVVAAELARRGLEVYAPCVDETDVDLILRAEGEHGPHYFDVDVKSVKAYNQIIGVKHPRHRAGNYLLVIHYRHPDRDEFFYLTASQVAKHAKDDPEWGDLVFNKPEREAYAEQDLDDLAGRVREGTLLEFPLAWDIHHAAARHTTRQLGMAIGVAYPRWEGGEWVADLIAPEGKRVIGHLYFTRDGELIEAKSATRESLTDEAHAGSTATSAA